MGLIVCGFGLGKRARCRAFTRVLRWGQCPDGQEALQAVDPNDVVVTGAFTPPDDAEQEVLYNETVPGFSMRASVTSTLQLAADERARRTRRLRLSDWLYVSDALARVSYGKARDFEIYRQALRDVPQQALFPATIAWPTLPALPDPLAPAAPIAPIGATLTGFTFARASTAMYTDALGRIVQAASGAARIDYDPVTKERRGLLIEPARTNLLLQSGAFQTSPWVAALATATAAAGVAPTGTVAAVKLAETASTGQHQVSQPVTLAAATQYWNFVAAKAVERGAVAIEVVSPGMTTVKVRADLSAGTILSGTGKIRALGSGWYEVAFPVTTVTGGASTVAIRTDNGTTDSYTGTAGSGILLWGAQCEAGLWPSTIIPTTTATVTRAADTASVALDDWWNPAESTIYIEADWMGGSDLNDALRIALQIDDGSANNCIRIVNQGAGRCGATIFSGGVLQSLWNGVASGSQLTRAALAVKTNASAASAEAATAVDDTVVTFPAGLTTLRLGNSTTTANTLGGHIRDLRIWPQRLSNAQLKALSS